MKSSRSRSPVYVFLFLLTTLSNQVSTQKEFGLCKQYLDLVFAIDASGSVKEEGYKQIKSFTKEIINSFDIGVSKTHVGVVTFSEYAELQIRLTDTFDKGQLLQKIDSLDYPGYRTALDDALRVVNSAMFSLDGGARQGVPQVLIFLTDGKCTVCTEDLNTVVAPLKAAGVTIYTVGVTNNINRTELEIISSDPSHKYMFEVETFGELKTIISKLNEKTCVVKKGKCARPLPPFNCQTRREDECNGDGACNDNQKCCFDGCIHKCQFPLANCLSSIDIAFALDSSRSVRADMFQKMKQFAIDIVDSFQVSQRDARFASLVFSNEAEVNFDFVRYDTATEVKRAINSFEHQQLNTNIHRALEKVKSDIFSLQGKVRTRRPMVLIVFYDGDVSVGTKDLAEIVAPLKAYGVKVVAIGVGPEVNTYQLNKIAQSSNTVFKAKNFEELLPELYSIAKESCTEKPGQCPLDRSFTSEEECKGVDDECDNDFDCFGNSKCCKQGCANKCYLPAEKCKRKVDIAFAIHQNMEAGEHELMKYFLRSSIDHFEISNSNSHAALITFGPENKVVFDFNAEQNLQNNLMSQIEQLKFVPGKAQLVDVLKIACDNIFCAAGGTRNNVPKMLVIVTGPFDKSDPIELSERVKILRSRGVDLLIIGVGNVDIKTIQSVTSDNIKIDNQVLLAKYFNGILQYVQDIADFACGEAGRILPPPSDNLAESSGQVVCSQAKVCIKGPKGSRGRPGNYGGRGEPGPRGEKGQEGLYGPKGPRGDNGLTGLTGERGPKGYIGLPGFPGFDGIPGVPGVEGRTGENGCCGFPGKPGEAGIPGLDGFQGNIGRKGSAGIKGKKGEPAPFDPNLIIEPGEKGEGGRNGESGIKGEKGEIGFLGMVGDDGIGGTSGPKGFMGDMGDEGVVTMEKGAKGFAGDRGDAGPPGPASATGTDSLQGPSGDSGPQGEKGDRGEPGPTSETKGVVGLAGKQGEKGDAGAVGEPGPKGEEGSEGEDGIKGEKGMQGISGEQGLLGIKGELGMKGFKGLDGPQGRRGDTGEPFPGKKGNKGSSGETGYQGPGASVGPIGPEGKKGEPGMMRMGETGDDGAVGLRGDPGTPGIPGNTGMEGLRGSKGVVGSIGSKGDTGRNAKPISGDPGMDGPPGPEGVVGSIGNIGEPGPRGPTMEIKCTERACPYRKGEPGPIGKNGDIGPPGAKGTTGLKGYDGGPCPVCPSGDDGISGDPGNPGKVGEKGEKGFVGNAGNEGKKGDRGTKGEQGTPGSKGKKGGSGDVGNVGPQGEDSPGNSIAEKGEIGLRGNDGVDGLRGKVGPKGFKGRRGLEGDEGRRGNEGPKGESGDSGEKGENGRDGRKGQAGEIGESSRGQQGDDGVIGQEGNVGTAGRIGPKGRKGEPGEAPSQEVKGDKGPQGPTGDIGPSGPPGPRGEDRGSRGPKGIRGNIGEKGPGGMKGDSGNQGRVGDDGDPGIEGRPGQDGLRGRPGEPGKPGEAGQAPKGEKGVTGVRGPDGKRGTDAPPPPGCFNFGDSADVGFIMDSSKSVNEADFNRQKEFIIKILEQFAIGPQETQAGVIKYGESADVEISFDDFYTTQALKNSIGGIQHDLARESRLDLALKLARDELFTKRRGARSDNDKVEQALVILGDGFISGRDGSRRQLMENARQYANDLKKEGVLIFTLAVGVEKNKFLLQDFASKESYYLEVQSYSELVRRIGLLKDNLARLCTIEGEPGKDGVDGPPGEKGPNGEKGQPGLGLKGFAGFDGLKGEKGDRADFFSSKGERGDRGSKGNKGEKGFDGFQGRYGYGNQGRKGGKGDRSDELKGFKGDQGDLGPQGPIGPDGQKLCDAVLATDILFVLDTSRGVGADNFYKMISFLDKIIRTFDVDNLLTRVSVMTFDTDARLGIALNSYNNEKDLLNAIQNLRYTGGEATRIDKALIAANKQGFAEENGSRVGVNKAIVFMTDGQSSYHPDEVPLQDAIKPLVNRGILRYAIGIGPEISEVEMKTIGGDNVLLAADFDALLTKIEQQIGLIGRGGCKGSSGQAGQKGQPGDDGFMGLKGMQGDSGKQGSEGLKGSKGSKGQRGESFGVGAKGEKGTSGDEGPIGLPGCTDEQKPVPTDLGFMIDASASLYDYGFKNELEFVNNIMDKVGPMSRDGLRAGVVVYSDKANSRIYMNDHYDTNAFKFAVKNLPYDNAGQTRIDLGFEESKNLFDIKNGARGSSKKVLILMTDGQQTYVPDIKAPSEIAKELALEGVDIFSIGIGEEIDRVELESFISKPEHIFLASDLKALLDVLVKEITQALTCEGGPRGPEGRPGNDGPPGEQGFVGEIGDTGRKGEQGDPGFGPKGELGEKGDSGFPGFEGEKGFRGPIGGVGLRGMIGEKGSLGRQGPKGDEGEMGVIGLPGFEGLPGRKGEKGDTFGEGAQGDKGEPGEKGLKGHEGDPGSLPPGNEMRDIRGEQGQQGEPGPKGSDGPKGKLRVAPGPIGLSGIKGNKGDFGEFGSTGDAGPQGFFGPQGEKGFAGQSGNKGSSGFPGLKGSQGKKGSEGDLGFSRKGEPGTRGRPGGIGEIGPEGEEGFFGFIGMPGSKGERGEAGPRGRQQVPTGGDDREMKGKLGEKGYEGDYGLTGEPGEPGIIIQQQGIFGEKGQQGPRGPKGEPGERGKQGMFGLNGVKGLKGRNGVDGDPGAEGRKGPKGDMGIVINGSEKGDSGDLGIIGLIGRPGIKGTKGDSGAKGFKGPRGPKGEQGMSGFPGVVGSQGPQGKAGNKGGNGDRGPQGIPGLSGPGGPSGTADKFGYYIVRHSQNAFIPRCPRDYKVLWEGYSLMYTVGNGYAHSQDLGDAGSCSRSFSTLPFLFCSITGTCKFASRNDFTYWLSGDVQQPMMPVSNEAIEPFISRCVVCEAPDISMAVHSQDVSQPNCPVGYESLWSGYSFMMVAAAGNTGAGQSLASSGSCLEEFRPKPFIECQGARGTCHFFSDKFSFWLTTIDPAKQFEVPQPTTLSKDKGDVLTKHVSRCRVCLRSSGSDINVPESGNTFSRFARRIKRWVGY